NVSVEKQLLALQDVNTRQNLEIRVLKYTISSFEKSICLIEEKLFKQGNELNKEKKCSSTQTENEQEADKDRIHALLTGTSELPVLRDEEKHVISEFCVNESLAETFLSEILEKIKVERGFMGHDLLQSLCRVYVGVCQQRGDSHKAHALAYRLPKE
ncbi:little elongation complex subunit 1, partial [Silurus asotus]